MRDMIPASEILELLDTRGMCLCGSRESCDICDSYSQFNVLRNNLKELIYGPKPKPTLENYGRSIKICL